MAHSLSENRARRQAIGLLIAGLAACILIYYNNLFVQFWCDEMDSLRYFELVPFRTTLTDYHDVNNHIGFNLLCNGYLKITGQHSFTDILFHPGRLRIFLMFIPCLTVWVLWRFGMEAGGVSLALISMAVLLTTLPFYNFALQLRGYALGTLLALGFIRYLYRYYLHQHKYDLIKGGLLLTYLIYVNPTNIYLAFCLCCCLPVLALLTAWTGKERSRFILSCWLVICAAALLGLALYLPMMKTLFSLPYTGREKWEWNFFHEIFLMNTYYFTSARYLPFLAAIAGFALYYRKYRLAPQLAFMLFCLMVYTGVHLIAFLRRDIPMARLFIFEMHFLLVPVSFGIYWCCALVPKRYSAFSTAAAVSLCFIGFTYSLNKRNNTIHENNRQGIFTSNLFSTLYLHDFNPQGILSIVQQPDIRNQVIVCNTHFDKDEADYLRISGICFYKLKQADTATREQPYWYLISNNALLPDTARQHLSLTRLNLHPYATNVFLVRRK